MTRCKVSVAWSGHVLSFIELECAHFYSRVRVTDNILPAMHLHVYMLISHTTGI